jgi:hypothetical protein
MHTWKHEINQGGTIWMPAIRRVYREIAAGGLRDARLQLS